MCICNCGSIARCKTALLTHALPALPGAEQKQDLDALRHRLGLSSDPAADSMGTSDGPPSQRSFYAASTSRLEVRSCPVQDWEMASLGHTCSAYAFGRICAQFGRC